MILSSEVLARPLVDGFAPFGCGEFKGVTNHYTEVEWIGLDSQKYQK